MKIPLVIVGGGVIGLTLAYYLSELAPEIEFIIIDKEKNLGDETTGRNSGALHAGLYYEKNSLKHQLCLKGNRLWKDLEKKLDLNINHCGKYIICSSENEESDFIDLYNKAKNNNIPKIKLCEKSELIDFKDDVKIHKAFLSESTCVLDVPDTISKLEMNLYNKNIPILKENRVLLVENHGDEGFLIKTDREVFYTHKLINCAGLGAVDLRKNLQLNNIENYFVKGHYIKLNKPFYNERLLYPMPPKSMLGLGVHTSFSSDGIIKFGPDTQEVDIPNYEMKADRIDQMYPSIKSLFPSIKKESLSLDYCGIRPKIKVEGKVYKDFWIKGPEEHGVIHYFETLGIESPGLTAAPAIALYLIDLIKNTSLED